MPYSRRVSLRLWIRLCLLKCCRYKTTDVTQSLIEQRSNGDIKLWKVLLLRWRHLPESNQC